MTNVLVGTIDIKSEVYPQLEAIVGKENVMQGGLIRDHIVRFNAYHFYNVYKRSGSSSRYIERDNKFVDVR